MLNRLNRANRAKINFLDLVMIRVRNSLSREFIFLKYLRDELRFTRKFISVSIYNQSLELFRISL